MNLAKKRKNMEFEEKNKKCNFHSSFGMFFRIISLYYTYINILIKKSFIFLFFFFPSTIKFNYMAKELLICSLSLSFIYIYIYIYIYIFMKEDLLGT